jgi:phage tail-like protein
VSASDDDTLPAVRDAIPAVREAGVRQQPGYPRGVRSQHWMLDQLPVGLLDGEFFVRFVSLFQHLGDSLLANADNVEHLADLSVTPDPMVRWLGSWIGIDALDPSLDTALQRRIVGGAAQTLAWRGTWAGLVTFLAKTTGSDEADIEVVDGGGIWRTGDAPADTAWVRMKVPTLGWLEQQDFIELVRDEVPAHVQAYLHLGEDLIWSSDGSPAAPTGEPTGMPTGRHSSDDSSSTSTGREPPR